MSKKKDKMNITPEDYDLIARWLDGEPLELTEEQHAVAQEISKLSSPVYDVLDVQVPAGVLHRVNARLKQALAEQQRQRSKTGRIGWLIAAAAAVIIAVSIWLFLLLGPGGTQAPRFAQHQPIAQNDAREFIYTDDDSIEMQIERLSHELANYRAELTIGENFPDEIVLAGIEQEIQDVIFGQDDPSASLMLEVPDDLLGTDSWKDDL